jgi:hypothetical protein
MHCDLPRRYLWSIPNNVKAVAYMAGGLRKTEKGCMNACQVPIKKSNDKAAKNH